MSTDFLQTAVTAAFAAGGAYMAVRMELKHLWHSIKEHAERIERIENLYFKRAD